MLVRLVIELESVVCVRKVLIGLLFNAIVGGNPARQLRSFFLTVGVGSLVLLESLVVPKFSYKAALGSSPERKRARQLPPINATALSKVPPAIIATLAVVSSYILRLIVREDCLVLEVLL